MNDKETQSLKVACVEWPEGLLPASETFARIAADVAKAAPDVLVTNEMPFGDWLADGPVFDRNAAAVSVEVHEAGLEALSALKLPLVISSRPVWQGDRLANEGFALIQGQVMPLHRKCYFPAEPGWHEDAWFTSGDGTFEVAELAGLKVGVLLCTELMFNERARAYGRQGADLIVAPRATGGTAMWQAACQMAAIVSGAYVVSSNRVGRRGKTAFAGNGLAVAPDGRLIGMTTVDRPIFVLDLDPEVAAVQKREYPCYVRGPA